MPVFYRIAKLKFQKNYYSKYPFTLETSSKIFPWLLPSPACVWDEYMQFNSLHHAGGMRRGAAHRAFLQTEGTQLLRVYILPKRCVLCNNCAKDLFQATWTFTEGGAKPTITNHAGINYASLFLPPLSHLYWANLLSCGIITKVNHNDSKAQKMVDFN